MGDTPQPDLNNPEAPSVLKLHSKEFEEILDVVDQLRSAGIDRYVDVPQIIVCGDQSSGKSSVLGALSEISFPWRDTVCTRFAIELILRRSHNSKITVSLSPDIERSSQDQERLRAFQSPALDLVQFTDIVRSAEEQIDLGRKGQLFSKDVLRIEVSGPTQPHLTLVDLPGLYHAPDEEQDEEGVRFVEQLVLSYMRKKRSTILAVVSAKNDIALQQVTSFTRKVDPRGERTMGIITKPDTLSEDSDMEKSFLKLARNERLHLDLGWHVLRNRNFEERHYSLAERHEAEAKFFAHGVWASLPRSKTGIDALRPRLTVVLKDHIVSQMSGFAAEIRSSLAEARLELDQLGTPRRNISEQCKYLVSSSEKFSALMSDAVGGNYFNPFFGDAMSDLGLAKRLRAVIQMRLLEFADSMRHRGAYRKIIEDQDDDLDDGDDDENCIQRSDFVQEVRQRMRRSRGRELPGTFNPLIIGELFYLQTQPWEQLVNEYTDQILEDVYKSVRLLLEQSLDDKSIDGLLKHVVSDSFTALDERLHEKTRELLKPQKQGHPITYNQNFLENVLTARNEHRRKFIEGQLKTFFGEFYPTSTSTKPKNYSFSMTHLLNTLAVEEEDDDMELFACSEATDCMLAYYEVARKKFVDDFSNLAVEKCLLEPLAGIFSPSTVHDLSDDIVSEIAREDETSKLERDRLEEKIQVLQMSISKLNMLGRSSVTATYQIEERKESEAKIEVNEAEQKSGED